MYSCSYNHHSNTATCYIYILIRSLCF